MKTYAERTGRKPDFVVSYRLYAPSEGGRKVTFQHLRCDFLYEGDDPLKDGIFMVYPEFLGEDGEPVTEGIAVPLEGKASMWVLSPEMRASVHRLRAKVGVQGHFMEGARKVGDIRIEAIVGLHEEAQST